jgi:hypothetical protein
MNEQHSIGSWNWRKTPLALAILATLPGTMVPEAFAASAGPAGPLPNPVGPEFQVNTYTDGDQDYPAVAMDAAGDFVVAWRSYGQDGDSWGIYAQRYDKMGAPQGAEFQVNTYTTSYQDSAHVAMDAAGDFVIVWDSYGQDGDGSGIYAQRYTAVGETQGSEFQVNTYTDGDQNFPAVAMNATGDFVVAWVSYGQDGSGWGIYAQRYDKTGAPQGSEFQVNTYTTGNQYYPAVFPAVAMDAAGDFVVAWTNHGQDGSLDGIFAQRYDKTGAPQGFEFQVNTYTTSYQNSPAVAMDAAGDFVVTWMSYGQDGDRWGIYAQRYDKTGAPQGSEFQVNTTTTGDQYYPAVAMDAAGDFVVAWSYLNTKGEIFVGRGIYAQRYNTAGVPQGSEFRVNTYTDHSQFNPAVAMDATGDFVVTWQSVYQDGSGDGVFAQRYALNNYNAAFSTPVIRNQRTDPPAVPPKPEALAGTFSFDATFCNAHNSAYPLTGLVTQTVTLTNNNCLVNRLYGPVGTPPLNPGLQPCGVDSVLDFSVTDGYSDYALAVPECVTVHYQIGLQNRKRFSFFVDVKGM